MRIQSITIKNVKSFRDETNLEFSEVFDILVGPNGGGKSNLLDVITITLRHFFLKGYSIVDTTDDRGLPAKDIREQTTFQQIHNHLEKFIGDSTESRISIVLIPTEQDIQNIATIKSLKNQIEQVLSYSYRNKPISSMDFVNRWDPSILKIGVPVRYEIMDNRLVQAGAQSLPESMYLEYLNRFELFLLLCKDVEAVDLKPNFLYFSPYRGETVKNLQANLSSENYSQLLVEYFGSTSMSVTSLIKLATHYFAGKRRTYEEKATAMGYQDKWLSDTEVTLVTKYLDKLGYTWKLVNKDRYKNIYEIGLEKDGREFEISQASSGEREIINFLLGIFAFNIRDGLIIVDEPELHLHPRWQTVLIDVFVDLAKTTGNKFLLSTHSPAFINQKTIPNVVRVFKDPASSSKTVRIAKERINDARDILHIVNSHNNERIFFSDKVVLVEGIKDRLVFESLLPSVMDEDHKTEIIEVLEVHGKENLLKYRSFLEAIEVPNFIVADLDYAVTFGDGEIGELFEADHRKIDRDVLKNKKSLDRKLLSVRLGGAIVSKNFSELEQLWKYISDRKLRLRENLNESEKEKLGAYFDRMKRENVFILQRGEIEDYLPEDSQNLEQVIELTKDSILKDRLRNSEDLISICQSILKS